MIGRVFLRPSSRRGWRCLVGRVDDDAPVFGDVGRVLPLRTYFVKAATWRPAREDASSGEIATAEKLMKGTCASPDCDGEGLQRAADRTAPVLQHDLPDVV